MKVNATLSPGESTGTSNLLVGLTPGPRVTGSLELDNGGNPYTGNRFADSRFTDTLRAGATINFNEPFGQGDVASLRYLTSGSGLHYGRASYQLQITDLTVGVAYAYLRYRLGREFEPLDAHGSANIASIFASYPLIRSRGTNLRLVGGVDYRIFRDEVDATSSTSKREATVGMIGLTGDHRDELLGGGWTSFSLMLSVGDLSIKTPVVEAIDRLTARTSGAYGKLAFELAREQAIAGPLSLYGELRGQLASNNLDSSEKMGLGGAYGVRAYPQGEAYGDQGFIATLEARLRLATLDAPIGGELQAVAFVDHGSIWLNQDPWSPGDNNRTLSAAGVGLNWHGGEDGFVVRTAYAFKLGNEKATSAPDKSGRFWFQLTKFF